MKHNEWTHDKKASEIVAHLQSLIAKHGDTNVYIATRSDCFLGVEFIQADRWGEGDVFIVLGAYPLQGYSK